jgi:hypothetical protein
VSSKQETTPQTAAATLVLYLLYEALRFHSTAVGVQRSLTFLAWPFRPLQFPFLIQIHKMFRFVTTLVLLWISAFASAQDTANTTETPEVVWGGCLDPFTGNSKVTIGEPTAICLVFANNENWFNKTVDYTRLTFLPTADEYSRFIVPACKSTCSFLYFTPFSL